MQVLFLAVGAARKRAVVEESAAVVAAGGKVVVLVGQKKPWDTETFAPGVRLVTFEELEARHLPRRIERAVLYRVPRRVAGAIGRGRLRGRTDKALKAYEKGVAGRVHRRVFLPVHRKLWPAAGTRMVRRSFGSEGGPDLIVVADALSIPRAVELTEFWNSSDGRGTPRIAYSVETAVPSPATAPAQPSAAR
ncbi:hypothetical protein [Streptomyces sp. NPDC050263]|uniref:hypothetical protein n=1 Tax=Streptomyces sp. NPDC050263 TaxID=3155037 RepID=UPI0034314D33